MPGKLATLIRSKYPGEYDDLDDITLEKSILEKYPDYADLVDDEPIKAASVETPKADFSNVVSGSSDGGFNDWYKGWSTKLGLDPNPDSPEQQYDYRAAYKAGAAPTEESDWHWPSEYKKAGHPNLIVDGVNTKTGIPIDPKAEMRKKLGYGRQDEQTFDLDKFIEGTNNVSNSISNAVGRQDWLPDIGKQWLAGNAALIPEAANFAASLLADPTAAATSSTVLRSLSRKSKLPIPETVIPPVVPPEAALETIVPPVVPTIKPKMRMKLDENGKNIGYEPIDNIPVPSSLDPNLNQGIGDPELAGSVPSSTPIIPEVLPNRSQIDAVEGSLNKDELTSLRQDVWARADNEDLQEGIDYINKQRLARQKSGTAATASEHREARIIEMELNRRGIKNTMVPEPFSDPNVRPAPSTNKTTVTIGGKTVDISGMENKQALEALGVSKSQVPSTPTNPAIAQRIEKQASVELQSQGVPPNVATVAAQVTTKVPELAAVVKDPGFIKKYLTAFADKKTAFNRRETPGSRLMAGLGSSIDSELDNQLPRLGMLVKQTQADSHIKAGGWIADYDNLSDPLSDTQFANLVEAIEGRAKPADDKVIAALVEYKKLDQAIQEEATATGMGLKSSDGSKTVPWVGRKNYWPHLYTEEFFDALDNNSTDIIASMTKAGKSPQEIQDLLSNSKKFGERLVDAQHARESDLPGYRTDRNVFRQHIADMSKRIVEAKNYGPMDLADNTSPLVSLIKESKNPEYSTKLMSKLLGRSGIGNQDTIHFSRKLVAAQAWMHLSTAGISNLASFAMTPLQTSVKTFVGGFAKSILDSKASGEFTKRSGAIQNIFREIFASSAKDTDRFMPTKLYGIDAGERKMRTVSASAGQAIAKELFEEMKDGSTNPIVAKRLQDLTLTNPAELSLQTKLNEQQLKRAAFRTAELSQGLAEMQNLPELWTGSAAANILTLFHKYQFAQTKIVKDLLNTGSVKQNLRNAGMLLAASQIAGEITGDAKAVVKGGVKAAYSQDSDKIFEEIANRGDFVAENFGLEDSPIMARFIENALQSFALGMYASVIEAMSGSGQDAVMQLAGSTASDLAKVWDIGVDLAQGDLSGATTKGTSMIPLVGPPVAAEMREEAGAR